MQGIEFDVEYAARVAERREHIMELVEAAARESGRLGSQVAVCAVSKTVDVPQVAAALEAGYTHFAENRPQELERKLGVIGDNRAFEAVSWHMIGNLQENKINHVLGCRPALVHSVSSAKLAAAVSKRAQARGMCQPVLLEVNVSGEESKSGLSPNELRGEYLQIAQLPGIDVRGLMTMAPQGDAAVAEQTFAGLRELRDALRDEHGAAAYGLTELSMGMSEDFREAIRQGATIIRLGRVVFDPAFPLT